MKIFEKLKITRRELCLILTSIICSVLVSTTLLWFFMPQKVVQFNLKSMLDLFSQQSAESHYTPQQQAQRAQAFAAALSQATKQYAKQNNVIVLVSPAVVSGAYDATKDIKALTYTIEMDSQ